MRYNSQIEARLCRRDAMPLVFNGSIHSETQPRYIYTTYCFQKI
jgi:hypothetical protein